MPCQLPRAQTCCRCIPELRTAVAIIASLAIVTSPVLSWILVRHSYTIRAQCLITPDATRPDVIDIEFQNTLSFGFGANAGLGSSCFSKIIKSLTPKVPPEERDRPNAEDMLESKAFIIMLKFIHYMGMIVLLTDVALIISAILVLHNIFTADAEKLMNFLKGFMFCCFSMILLTFIYGLVFVIVCHFISEGFPIFEAFFLFFDAGLWCYFLIVVNTYRHELKGPPA